MCRVFLLSLLCSLSMWAQGANVAPAGVVWLCGLSEDLVRLVCLADPGADAEAPLPARPAAVVRGTAFPLDPTRLYHVDLWTPPSDPDFVRLLAQSTLCYRSPNCRVVMAGTLLRDSAIALAGRR